MDRYTKIFLVLLVVAFGLLFSFKMGAPALFEDDEGRITEVAREILVTGKWIDLQFNYEPWFHKPPLYPWLTAVTFFVFGISEFTARIWAALFGLGTLIVTYFLGRSIYDEAAGGLAAIMTGSSLLFLSLSRAGFVDTGLTFFVALSVLLFHMGYSDERRKGLLILSALAMALGTLVKGPLGLLLPGGSIFIYILCKKDFGFFARYFREIGLGALVYFAAASPWWIAETIIHGGAFLEGLFGQYMLGIYSTAFQKHSGPIYFYIIVILVGMMPWSVHAAIGLYRSLRSGERDRALLLLILSAVVFAVFSLAQTKIPGYILPIFPPLTIIAAGYLKGDLASGSPVNRSSFAVLLGLTVIFFLASLFVRVPEEYLVFTVAFRWMTFIFAVLSAAAFALVNIRNYAPLAVVPLLLMSVTYLVFASEIIIPAFEYYKPVKRMAEEVREYLPSGYEADYYNYKTWYRSSLPFYMKARVTHVDDVNEMKRILKGKRGAVFFTDTKIFNDVRRSLPPGSVRIDTEADLVSFTNVVGK